MVMNHIRRTGLQVMWQIDQFDNCPEIIGYDPYIGFLCSQSFVQLCIVYVDVS